VIVPVAVVGGMPMAVVRVIDMIIVRDSHVPATCTVDMVMSRMFRVFPTAALVRVVAMNDVEVAIVRVVGVIAVGNGYVPTAFTVDMGVGGMLDMSGCHRCSS